MPTYYPNSSDPQGAQPVRPMPGTSHEGVDIQMLSSPMYCIDGRTDVPTGAAAASFQIAEKLPLLPPGLWSSGQAAYMPAIWKTEPDGHFRVCGLHQGKYRLTASSADRERSHRLYAAGQATLVSDDLHDVKLTARPGVVLSGEVVWDPPPPDQHVEARVSVGLQPLSAPGVVYGDWAPAPGRFSLDPVPVDDYLLQVRGLPEGSYVKQAYYGVASVLDAPIRLTTMTGEGRLRVVLGGDGGFLRARVSDRDGNPVARAYLYIMGADADSEVVFAGQVDWEEVKDGWGFANGARQPGRYLVIASDLPPGESADFISTLWNSGRSRATAVDIRPWATVQVTLSLTGLD